MATVNPSKPDYMAMPGPEDQMTGAVLSGASTWRYGGSPVALHDAKDVKPADSEELSTLSRFITSAPYSTIIETLGINRNICMRQLHELQTCAAGGPAQTAVARCAPSVVSFRTCQIKLARAVQYECGQETKTLGACYRENGADNSLACFDAYQAFDRCTEDF